MINVKKRQKHVAMGLLFMLATSTLTVNYAQADMRGDEFQDSQIDEFGQVRTVLSEQIIEGQLKLKFFGILGDMPQREIQDILSKEGAITGWHYLDAKAYKSGIILYNGKSLDDFSESRDSIEELDYQIILSAKNSKNAEGIFALIVIDKDPKLPQDNQKLNLFSPT